MVPMGRFRRCARAIIVGVLVVGPACKSGLRAQPQLVLVGREGSRQMLGRLPASTFAPRIAPNGRELTFDADGVVWVSDLRDLTSMRRLASGASFPMWSGDGERILFISRRNGEEALSWLRSDGTGAPELLAQPARAPESWSPQLQAFSFITFKNGDYDVWTYSLNERKATPLVEIAGSSQHSSRFSPDGRWVAYASNETSKFEVYVQPVPTTGAKFLVSKNGGGHPLWSPDGRELFYDSGGRLFSVAIRTEPRFESDDPAPLPITGFIQGGARRQYDVMPDGKHFLMMFP
jgi:hypothetical protein